MRRDPTARLFVAVDPPSEVCERLCAWARTALRGQRREAREGTVRVLDAELLHITLWFLGDLPVGEIGSLCERLADSERGAASLSLGAPLWLPPRRPRTLAVEVHDPDGQLARLQSSVQALMESPRPSEDRRGHSATRIAHGRFRPHVTVARTRGGALPPSGLDLPPTPQASFLANELILYRSWLSPEGASYEPLASFQLE